MKISWDTWHGKLYGFFEPDSCLMDRSEIGIVSRFRYTVVILRGILLTVTLMLVLLGLIAAVVILIVTDPLMFLAGIELALALTAFAIY